MKLRHYALAFALGELGRGVREQGRNWSPRIEEYLRLAGIAVPAAWCAAFVYWCVHQAAEGMGFANPLAAVHRKALVFDYWTAAEQMGWIVPAHEADAGDLVLFDFPGGNPFDHVGFVVQPPGDASDVVSLDGNTNDEGAREGYEVAVRTRSIERWGAVFVRYDEGNVREEALV